MTADLAVVAMAVIALANAALDHRFRMKVADRLRVVNPAKAQQQDAGAQDKPVDLTQRRTGT